MSRKTLIGEGAVGAKRKKRAPAGKSAPQNVRVAGVEVVAIEKLRPAAYNPRKELKPGDSEFEKLRRSIEEFGLVDPPVWNKRTGNLVGGHQRLAVFRHLYPDVAELSVMVIDKPLLQEKKLNVALNKIAGAWDEERLTELLREVQLEGDATATGFDQSEIDALLAEVAGQESQPGETVEVGHSYKVIVNCTGAEQQNEVVAAMKKMGLAAHTITRE